MKILNRLKTIIKKTDMFYATDMLRFDKEGEYSTLTGGILSAGIIVAILVGFASMILNTLDLSVITTQLSLTKQIDPTPVTLSTAGDSHFMFGIQLWKLNLSDSKRYFDVNMIFQHSSGGELVNYTTVNLEQCTHEHWTLYPQLIKNFDKLQASGWLCPSADFSYELRGKYTSSQYSSLVFLINPCSNASFPENSCAPQSQIDELFLTSNYFYFTFYFLNPVINSDKKDYKSYYLEEKTYVIFGNETGSEAYLYFADYTITTDNSIWPYTNEKVDKGVIVLDPITIRTYPRHSEYFVYFSIDKSPNSIVYNRQVQKISSVFSFIGGMISAISAGLFIIKIYNSLSFELSIALQIFKPQKDSGLENASLKMNIFNFFRYYFYVFTKEIGRPLNNKTLHFINECQEQILSQLDIKQLVKRIIFIEHCLNFIFEDYQMQGLQVKKPTSPQEIRRIRRKCESIENESADAEYENQNQDASSSKSSYQVNVKVANTCMENSDIFSPNRLSNHEIRHKKLVTIHKKGKQKDLQIIDINSENMSAFDEIANPNIRNKLKFQLRKDEYLKNLQKDAAIGNPTSKKIWNFVEKQT